MIYHKIRCQFFAIFSHFLPSLFASSCLQIAIIILQVNVIKHEITNQHDGWGELLVLVPKIIAKIGLTFNHIIGGSKEQIRRKKNSFCRAALVWHSIFLLTQMKNSLCMIKIFIDTLDTIFYDSNVTFFLLLTFYDMI